MLEKIILFIIKNLQCVIYFIIFYYIYSFNRIIMKLYLEFNNLIVYNYSPKIDLFIHNNSISNNNVVVFINGGGFIINGNTDLVVSYHLLKKLKNIIILSIQYNIEYSFDDINKQVLYEYNNIKKNHNIISIISDSAGSSLALNLIFNLKEKQNIKFVLLSPWLNIKYIKFNESISYIINDDYDIINIEMINKIYNYKFKNKNFTNILNMLSIPEDLIKKIPETFIMTGSKEILLDDSIQFYNNLQKNNIKSEIKILKNQNHGYFTANGMFSDKVEKIVDNIINFSIE